MESIHSVRTTVGSNKCIIVTCILFFIITFLYSLGTTKYSRFQIVYSLSLVVVIVDMVMFFCHLCKAVVVEEISKQLPTLAFSTEFQQNVVFYH
jgi:hypothetical protein